MNNFNFSGVSLPEDKQQTKFVQPGVQELTITEVKDVSFNTGAVGIEVSFSSNLGGTFSQRWALVDNQKQLNQSVMQSFQYLINTFTGQQLDGDVNTTMLSSMMVGKTAVVTVGGRKYTSEKDGKKYNNIRAELPFGGYQGEKEPYIRGEWDTNPVATASSNGGDNFPF